MIKRRRFIFFLLALPAHFCFAKVDTLHLDLPHAEQLFLKNNANLLLANFQVEQAGAAVITAKLFDNPELEYENLFYNHENKKFLQTSAAYGQYSASVAQLFKLAGKRDKSIKLAQTGVKLAELEYYNLLRSLKFELRSTFYQIYFASQSLKVYDEQISSTEGLLNTYHAQLKAGNVAPKEVIRIKSLLIALKAEKVNLLNELEDQYQVFKIICGLPAETLVSLSLKTTTQKQLSIRDVAYTQLIDSAYVYRADLKLAKTEIEFNERNLSLQKAMAIPDVEIAFSYDLKGNYPEKYTGLGIKIPIPLFNRNQGEIKKARIGISMANTTFKQQQLLLANEVLNSYKTALRYETLYTSIDKDFSEDFNQLISGLISNFKQRNVSLIEFLDLYTSYKDHVLQFNTLQFEKMNSREELNYVTGTNIFN